MAYYTPGVYIEEIPKLPASVAEVETAIPAFIGYTQKALKKGESLSFKPTRIGSMVEYVELFGEAPPYNVTAVNLDSNNVVKDNSTINNSYLLFDSLRMYFANGGGDCYIVSVGQFPNALSQLVFEQGLDALKKADEPTLILFPDAVLMGRNSLKALQTKALDQCNLLKDRFCVFDLIETGDPKQDRDNFRDDIGMNNLKYGAVYYPNLKSALPKNLRYGDIRGKLFKGGINIDLRALTSDAPTQTKADELDKLVDDLKRIQKNLTDFYTANGNIRDIRAGFVSKFTDFDNETNSANKKTKLETLFKYYFDVLHLVNGWAAGGANELVKNAALLAAIKTYVTNTFAAVAQKVRDYNEEGIVDITMAKKFTYGGATIDDDWVPAVWGTTFNAAATPSAIFNGSSNLAMMNAATPAIRDVFEAIAAGIDFIVATATETEKAAEDSIMVAIPVLKDILDKVNQMQLTLPPSGAIAGAYAAVDRDRGVWKAPANVSLNLVSGLTQELDDKDQEMFNVDVSNGKSVNVIRKFTGKGFIVWGARTLTGNDNEWRYVSTRRFYNFVEESVKKSTNWAVFEPNDANTWVKVKSMIENFLNNLWRRGALAGAKPDQAYFVNVGLGITMTPQDILEGRMNVEIGMAVVRPAEFIILKFSHKLQQS
ncbi:MAG: phage tail sheath C-terminal domain-containing protein [Spirosomataceae bacterium]